MALPLVELGALALVLWAVAMALAAALLMKKIGAVVHHIPAIGGAIAGVFDGVAQAITNAAGALEAGTDKLIGASWHALAKFTDELWNAIKAHSGVLAKYGGLLGTLLAVALHARSLAHSAARAVSHGVHRFTALTRDIARLGHRVKRLEHDLAHGIGDDVLPRLKSLDHRLTHVTHDVIPAIRAADAEADAAINNLYEWAKGKASLLGVGTFAFAVTAVLSLVGLDWLACRSRSSANGKSGCALWNDLEQLLAVGLVTFAIPSLEEFVHEGQDIIGDVTVAVQDVFGVG